VLAEIKALNEKGSFAYSRYDAIGLFRLLELAKAAEPAALEKLAGAAGFPLAKVGLDGCHLIIRPAFSARFTSIPQISSRVTSWVTTPWVAFCATIRRGQTR
jgi:hypothetical protein